MAFHPPLNLVCAIRLDPPDKSLQCEAALVFPGLHGRQLEAPVGHPAQRLISCLSWARPPASAFVFSPSALLQFRFRSRLVGCCSLSSS